MNIHISTANGQELIPRKIPDHHSQRAIESLWRGYFKTWCLPDQDEYEETLYVNIWSCERKL